MIDFQRVIPHRLWAAHAMGDEDSPALVSVAETALERQLSARTVQAGAKPKVRKVAAGRTLVEQGDPGDSLLLLLDGALAVEVDGEKLAEIGPGAILGERAVLDSELEQPRCERSRRPRWRWRRPTRSTSTP